MTILIIQLQIFLQSFRFRKRLFGGESVNQLGIFPHMNSASWPAGFLHAAQIFVAETTKHERNPHLLGQQMILACWKGVGARDFACHRAATPQRNSSSPGNRVARRSENAERELVALGDKQSRYQMVAPVVASRAVSLQLTHQEWGRAKRKAVAVISCLGIDSVEILLNLAPRTVLINMSEPTSFNYIYYSKNV